MKARDIISMTGYFFMGMGALLISQNVPPWAWWTGQVMIIAGPILAGSRSAVAVVKARQESKMPLDNEPPNH